MSYWRAGGLQDNARREAILAATRLHDDGWREEDAELHVSDSGEPLDFIAVPAYVKQRIWPRAVERLGASSSYVAALVAQHAITVHAPYRDREDWQRFFLEMEAARNTLLATSAVDAPGAFANDYAFVRTGDQLSLLFCNAWTDPLVGNGYRARLVDGRIEIAPDPFGGARVPLRIAARSLPARRYASAADLRAEYAHAPLVTIEGEASGWAPGRRPLRTRLCER